MGVVDDVEVVAAIDLVTRACRQNNIALGYFGVDAESVKPYIDKGYNLICTGVDAGFVTQGAQQVLQQLTP
jgi:2-dehydro-3-deoxyglucarate aldolase/4-hydroxy-2-oxoheptanedioate aldolase